MLERLRGTFSQAPRTIRLVLRIAPSGAGVLLVLTLASAGIPIGVAYAGKRIIDAVVARSSLDAWHWVAIELAAVAALSLATRGMTLMRSVLGARMSIEINAAILEKAIGLSLRDFEDPTFYDQLTRARREASSRPISVVLETVQIAQNTITLAGYAALLLGFSGWAVLGLVVAAIPATIAEMRFAGEGFRLRSHRAPETRRLNYLEHVLANDSYAKEVRSFGLGPLFLGRYRTLGRRLYDEDRRLAIRRAAVGWLLSLLATFAFYGCYAYLAIAAALGRLSLGELTLYVVAFRQGQSAFSSVLSAIGGMYEDNLYMTNLFAFLERPPGPTAASEHATTAPAQAQAQAAGGGIVLDDVGFRYPGQDRWALRHISLTIPEGKSLALVGQNGSGKTTLIKLLTRMYTPTEGRILLDGRDLATWGEEELRQRIGVVFQDYGRYQLSFRENVGMGSVDHLDDEARILRAAERGGADEILAGLKDGLETQLGRWFRLEGVELSGGQWQRVALSRAYVREEADILVLDEPTAALDAEAEAAVYERFRKLAEGKTTILISHRFPTVRGADRIVVLADGAIQESGTHEELLAADGRYARLFRLQAQGYL